MSEARHDCEKNPMPEEETAFRMEKDRVHAATDLWFPNTIDVVQGKDGKWYLTLSVEYAVQIEVCPFCGFRLA